METTHADIHTDTDIHTTQAKDTHTHLRHTHNTDIGTHTHNTHAHTHTPHTYSEDFLDKKF